MLLEEALLIREEHLPPDHVAMLPNVHAGHVIHRHPLEVDRLQHQRFRDAALLPEPQV